MTERNAALVAGGSAVFASSTLALLIIWLLLTRPLELANAVTNPRNLTDLLTLVATTLYETLRHLLQLL
jgi:uncharacterized membrane-anchored protein